jgi:hypothetical protein
MTARRKRTRKTLEEPVLTKRTANPKVLDLAKKAIATRPAYQARSYLRGLAQIDPRGVTSRAVRRMAEKLEA